MGDNMKKIFIICLIVFIFIYGCASMDNDSVCTKPDYEGSILCKILYESGLASPEQADIILCLASAAYFKKNPEQAALAIMYIDHAIKFIEGEGVTYTLAADYLISEMPITFYATKILKKLLGIQDIITPEDKGMIIFHLKHQRETIQGYI